MLIARPRPLKHEHVLSYLIRLTQLNGYKSVVQLLQACNRPTLNNRIPAAGLLFGESAMDYIYKSCGFGKKVIKQHLFRQKAKGFCEFDGHEFPRALVSTHHIKFCPQCFTELGYTPDYHLLTPYTFCHLHHKALIDTVYSGKTLGWGNKNLIHILESCEDFSSTQTIPSSAQKLSKTIGEMASGHAKTKTCIGETEFDLRNFLILIAFLHRFASRRYKQLTIKQTSDNACNLKTFGAVYLLTENWPEGFYDLLRYFEKKPMSNRGVTGLRHCYRDLYDDLYTGIYRNTTAYDFLRERFEKYINRHFKQSALNESVIRITNPRTKYLSQKQVLHMLQWPPSRLKVYVNNRLITPRVHTKTGSPLYSRHEILELQQKIKEQLTLKEAAEELQISIYQTRKLLMAQHISAIIFPDNQTRDWIIDKHSILMLADKLKSLSNSKTDSHLVKISLKQLTLRGYDIADVIEHVTTNRLVCTYRRDTKNPNALKQFTFYYAKHDLPLGYNTPKQAAKILKININAIYDFLRLGFLNYELSQVQRTTRPVKLIASSSLKKFQDKFALSRQLTQDQKLSYKLISGPDIDGATVKLFRRPKPIHA